MIRQEDQEIEEPEFNIKEDPNFRDLYDNE